MGKILSLHNPTRGTPDCVQGWTPQGGEAERYQADSKEITSRSQQFTVPPVIASDVNERAPAGGERVQ